MNKEYMNDKDTLEYIVSDEEGNLTRRHITGDVDKILDLENRIELLEWTKTKVEKFILEQKLNLKACIGIIILTAIVLGVSAILLKTLIAIIGTIWCFICEGGAIIYVIKTMNKAKKQIPTIDKSIEFLKEKLHNEESRYLNTSNYMFNSKVLECYKELKQELERIIRDSHTHEMQKSCELLEIEEEPMITLSLK